jgi:hypothetical protein
MARIFTNLQYSQLSLVYREKAITATGDSSLEAAMDWIIAHSEEHQEPEAEKSKPLADEEVLMESAENQTAKSIKCDE